LSLFGAVFDRMEQRNISTGEHARIQLIALALVLVSGSQLATVGDDHFAARISEQSADPETVGANFDGDAGSGICFCELSEAIARVGDFALSEGVSFVINHANGVAKVSKINSNDRGEK